MGTLATSSHITLVTHTFAQSSCTHSQSLLLPFISSPLSSSRIHLFHQQSPHIRHYQPQQPVSQLLRPTTQAAPPLPPASASPVSRSHPQPNPVAATLSQQ